MNYIVIQYHLHFVDTLQSHHFFPVITLPTRYSSNDNTQPSLLDQIWCNSLNLYNAGVVRFDFTDHLPTFLQFPFFIPKSKIDETIKISFRINNQENREKFRQVVTDFDWSVLDSDDINVRTENFTRKLDSIYCSIFPLKTKIIPKKKR